MGMRPQDFWSLSPGEWRALTRDAQGLTRAGLDALVALYPDRAS